MTSEEFIPKVEVAMPETAPLLFVVRSLFCTEEMVRLLVLAVEKYPKPSAVIFVVDAFFAKKLPTTLDEASEMNPPLNAESPFTSSFAFVVVENSPKRT